MTILPVSNIINVSITNTPSGLLERNVNSLMLLTNETPNTLDDFAIYISASQVADDYGTDSLTAAMANAIFSQSPNLRSGNGTLTIAPMVATSATAGRVTTADLTSTLASVLLVSNGDLKATINGTAYNVTGLDFTNCETWSDVAEVLQKKFKEVVVEATANGFKMTSKKVGSASAVTLGAVSGGTGTDLSGTGYFKASTSVAVTGANSSGETILNAIDRLKDQCAFVGVITSLDLEDAAIVTIANGIQAQDRMFLHHFASTQDIAGIATTISTAGNTKTRCLLHTNDMATANLFKAAYAGRAFSVNFRGSRTSQTMNLKQLATITPDTGITQTNYLAADAAGMDLYVSYEGVPSVFSSRGNDFFDNPYSDLALKFALQTAGFNYLRQTNTKVPQTETGMNGLKNAYSQVLTRFVNNGCVAPGSWTSSETFGDPEIFRENILNQGYYIYSLPIIYQDAAERELRKAPLVQIAVKRAGAIHTSDVIVIIND